VIVVFDKGAENKDKVDFLTQNVSDEMIPIVSSNAVINKVAMMIPIINTIIAGYAVPSKRCF
jgi:hypothetical protein